MPQAVLLLGRRAARSVSVQARGNGLVAVWRLLLVAVLGTCPLVVPCPSRQGTALAPSRQRAPFVSLAAAVVALLLGEPWN